MEGFATKDVPEASGALIMTKLVAELESMSSKKNLSNVALPRVEKEQLRDVFWLNQSLAKGLWSLVKPMFGLESDRQHHG